MAEDFMLDSTVTDDASQTEVVDSSTSEVTTGEEAAPAEQQVTETPKPSQTREENAQYKALRLSEKQAAIDNEYASLAQRYSITKLDGTPIKTKAEFESTQEALQKKDALVMQGQSEAEALATIQLEQFKQRDTERETQAQEQARINKEIADFYSYFEEANGRKFTLADKEELEKSGVLESATREGMPLKAAYALYEAKKLKEQQKALDTGKRTQEANAQNATTTTGSVTGGGATSDEFFTPEQVKAMSQAEVNKHLDAIEKSMKKW